MASSAKELRVILFGTTGMIGSGVLQACLDDEAVTAVLSISRSGSGRSHPKLQECLHADFYNYGAIASRLAGYNACLFALGVSSVGMNEEDYSRVTYDLTLAAAEAMLKANPGSSFCYISGRSTDSSEKGPVMWARVKGRIENKLLSMDFHPAVMLRPGGIQPMKGFQSRTRWYRIFYQVMGPVLPLLVKWFPDVATTAERLGRTMLIAACGEGGKQILESADINRLGAQR